MQRSYMRQIQVQGKDIRGLSDVLARGRNSSTRQIFRRRYCQTPSPADLTQGLKFSDLTEQLDFLGTIRQLRHATLVRTDPAHDARVKQPNDEFGRISALIIGRLAQLHVDFLRLLRRAFRIGVARRNGSCMTASSLITDSSIGPPALVRLCIHSPCGVSVDGRPPAAAMAWNSVRNTGVMKLDSVRLANNVGSTASGTCIRVAMNCCSQMNTASSMR